MVVPMFEGGLVYWMPAFDLDAFVAHAAGLAITSLFSVPAVYAAIAKRPAVTS